MRDQGIRPGTLRLTGGQQVVVNTSYFSRNECTARRGKGLYPGLLLLGIHHRCTPALADRVAQLSAAMASFEEAETQLTHEGIHVSVKTITTITYQYAQRVRCAQQVGSMDFGANVNGKRVVISTDGGRVRIRRKKRGNRTPKGRNRYHTDWREPKLLIIYVVDDSGHLLKEFSPVIDGTMNGPDAIFGLIEYYLRALSIQQADRVLFVADGAKWIWERVPTLWRKLGLPPKRCHELVDFYHAVEHLYSFAKLKKKWSSSERDRWVRKLRRYLLAGKVERFLDEVKSQSQGRISKLLRRERRYLIRNGEAGRLDYAKVASYSFPMGSGSMESSVRRVINLRLKGAGIFWHEESANAMLLLRSYYKAGRWETLQKQSLTYIAKAAA